MLKGFRAMTAHVILGLFLLFSALAAFFGGMTLVPTELGLTFYMMGAVLLGSAAMVLAMGFSSRLLAQALHQLAQAMHVSARDAASKTPDINPAFAPVWPPKAAIATDFDAIRHPAPPVFVPLKTDIPAMGESPAPDLEPATTIDPAPIPEFVPSLDRENLSLFEQAPRIEIAVPPDRPEPLADMPAAALPIEVAPEIAPSEAIPAALEAPETLESVQELSPTSHIVDEASIASTLPASEALEPEPSIAFAPQSMPDSPDGLIADADKAAIKAQLEEEAPPEAAKIVGSYQSGGVQFTMYADGSVLASGPDGDQLYPDLATLRKALNPENG
jgi:hypothetical protein